MELFKSRYIWKRVYSRHRSRVWVWGSGRQYEWWKLWCKIWQFLFLVAIIWLRNHCDINIFKVLFSAANKITCWDRTNFAVFPGKPAAHLKMLKGLKGRIKKKGGILHHLSETRQPGHPRREIQPFLQHYSIKAIFRGASLSRSGCDTQSVTQSPSQSRFWQILCLLLSWRSWWM